MNLLIIFTTIGTDEHPFSEWQEKVTQIWSFNYLSKVWDNLWMSCLHYTVKTSAFSNIVQERSGSDIITTITLPSPAWSNCGRAVDIWFYGLDLAHIFITRNYHTWWGLPLTDDWLCLIWYLDVDKLVLTWNSFEFSNSFGTF